MNTSNKNKVSIKKVLFAALAWGLIISGCSDSDKKSVAKPSFKVESLTTSAWLYGSLPQNTVAYVRAPNLWAGFSAKEDSFKYALGNEQHVKVVQQIQQGLQENIISKLQDPAKSLAEFYVEHTTGPVELAFVSQNGQPVILTGTRLDYQDETSFNEALVNLISGIPNANHMPQDDAAKGVIGFGPGAAVYYSYDASNQRFLLISGMGVSITSLENAAATIKPNDKHEMLTLEQDIDASHQGLFVWASPKNAMPFMQMGMQPQQIQKLKELGVDKANGLAFGYGVTGGKTRLKLLLDMPSDDGERYLPAVENKVTVKSVGTPKWASVISIPTAMETEKLVSKLHTAGIEDVQSWQEINSNMEKALGLSLETLLNTFGPEVTVFSDAVGTFAAVTYNKGNIEALLKKAQAQDAAKVEYQTYQKNSTVVHHLSLAPLGGKKGFAAQSGGSSNFAPALMANYQENIFWIIEGQQVIFASVPQLLLERQKRGADVSIANWFEESQGYDPTGTLIGFTASVDGLSRSSYHYYAELLIILSDLTGANIDLLALPTADELGFPEKGAIGFNIRSDKDILGIEFTFENGGTDLFLGLGSTSSVAVIGILAAVAIPAYQDYTIRAETSAGMYAAEAVKVQITEALMLGADVEDLDNGYENIQAAEEYGNSAIEKIVVNDGVMTVFFRNQRLGYGPQTIVYVPVFEDGHITYWDCTGGTVDEKHRPARCR
ncbi:pilin [Kangiella marina]|uniref:Pilin n=1 Tax=Kangiella marina TaxID=1079178 RepID=A0ABP8IE39_9GAMM